MEDIIRQRHQMVLELCTDLGWHNHTDRLLPRVLEVAVKALRVDGAAIQLADASGAFGKALRFRKSGDASERTAPEGLARYVMVGGAAVISNTARNDPRAGWPEGRLGPHAFICIPLLAGDNPSSGVLYLERDKADFEGDDLDFAVALAGITAVAVERERLNSELQRLQTNG